MQGKTHLAAGIAAGMALTGSGDLAGLALGGAVGGLAGLIPDWLQVNIPGVKQIQGAFGHRGFSHWLWTPLAVALWLRSVAPGRLALALFAGWASHILLDALSSGVPAFWPFGRLRLGKIKTGGKLDTLTGSAALVVLCALATRALFLQIAP